MKHTLALVLMVFGLVGCSQELSFTCFAFEDVKIAKDFNSIKVDGTILWKAEQPASNTAFFSNGTNQTYLYHTKLKELTTFKQVNGKQVTDLCHRK